MGLEFIYGPASVKHESALVEKAAAWLDKAPDNQVFYLVPNHVKFETEVSVLENLHQLPRYANWSTMTTMRLQVFSFTRLAWYYLQHTALYQNNQLSEAGTHLVIRKLLLNEAKNLQVFRGEVNKAGFIKQLADLFKELQAGNIGEEDLVEIINNLGDSLKEQDFKGKLKEFNYLYSNYLLAIGEKEVGTSQLLTDLANYLAETDLSKVMFVITGFSRFTAREKQLLEMLIQKAAEVKVDLVLDKPAINQLPEGFDMFFDAGKLYFELYHHARSQGVKVYQDTHLKGAVSPDLGVLDEFWRESQKLSPAKKQYHLSSETIQIWEGETPFTEINHVAKEIRHLVATTDIRYRDIEILSRDLGSYQGIIGPVFKAHEIPYYLNQELEMTHHPLVEFLTTLFAIKQRFYRYGDVMRFLRTELFMPKNDNLLAIADWQQERDAYRDHIDITENVVLAYGYEGFYWTQEKDWLYVQYDFANEEVAENHDLYAQRVSNSIRQDLKNQLQPFYKALDQAKTGAQGAKILYQFLISAGVEDQLIYWRNQDIEAGRLEEAKVHEQTWQAFIQLLDEYVDILGPEPFDLTEFVTIFETGLEGLTYNKVPTTIDQVSFSSLDLIHAQKNRVTFIIGATDNVFPQKIENKTLLSDEERSLVDSSLSEGKFLIKDRSRDLIKEPYIAYLAFQSTSERLYLTYPSSSDRSKDIKPSPYLSLLNRKLGVPIRKKLTYPENNQLSLEFTGTYRTGLTDLNGIKRLTADTGEQLGSLWLKLEEVLLSHPEYQQLSKHIFDSQAQRNIPETLTPEMVQELYGETIYGSVSKIETFHQCQYKYFMNYGLQLKERDVFGLTPAATGDFYHDALDQLFKVLIREQLTLSELTPETLQEVTEQVLQGVLGENKFSILNANHRMNYIRYQLSQTIRRVSWALQKQSQRTGLTTVQTEVLFGQIAQQSGLDSLHIQVAKDKQLKIRGKIDRLDHLEVANQHYLAVVDYKSSRHSFDYRDAYFGLAMQMITYLDVALSNAVELIGQEQVKPAGAFYLQVKNPRIEGNIDPDETSEALFKEFGYQGILLNDQPLLERLDHTLTEQPKSSIFPYEVKKNGEFKSREFVSENEIDLLIKQNRRNFQGAGEEIYQGKTQLNPAYRDNKRVACQYCPFRSVCQFDSMLKENNYHTIDKMTKNDVLFKITEKEGGNVNED